MNFYRIKIDFPYLNISFLNIYKLKYDRRGNTFHQRTTNKKF